MRLLLMISLLFCNVAGLAAVEIATPTLTVPALDKQHKLFAQVLQKIVKVTGVDYATLRSDTSALDTYRAQIAHATVPSDKNEKLAFYMNAYNAFSLALVAEQLPSDQAKWKTWSIKNAGGWFTGVWKYYTFEMAGTWVTLDHLEHSLLRPLGEPRIHFAINCASRSCPALAITPYVAATLDLQLDAATRSFTSDPNQLRLENGNIVTNPILSWFADDFSVSGGVRAFLINHVPNGPLAKRLIDGAELSYFPYDWSLNLAVNVASPQAKP